MSLDFSVTQWFRLIYSDLSLICDVYYLVYMHRARRRTLTLREFGEVLMNLMEVEACNFDDNVSTDKLSDVYQDHYNSIVLIVYDYLNDVVAKHLLDDLSQYPFFVVKLGLTMHCNNPSTTLLFGTALIKSLFSKMLDIYKQRGLFALFEGSMPYAIASMICNYRYLLKATDTFVRNIISKIPPSVHHPHPVGLPRDIGIPPPSTALSDSNHAAYRPADVTDSTPTFHWKNNHPNSSNSSKKPRPLQSSGMWGYASRLIEHLTTATLSHPFLLISLTIATNPIYRGYGAIYAYLKLVSTEGWKGLYKGLRSNMLLSLLPLSPFMMFGITDMLLFKRMIGQGDGSSYSVLTTTMKGSIEENSPSSSSSLGHLFTYGTLTLAQVGPGFVAFCGMRFCAWMVLGSSQQRKFQFSRRTEIILLLLMMMQIISAHLSLLDKKQSS